MFNPLKLLFYFSCISIFSVIILICNILLQFVFLHLRGSQLNKKLHEAIVVTFLPSYEVITIKDKLSWGSGLPRYIFLGTFLLGIFCWGCFILTLFEAEQFVKSIFNLELIKKAHVKRVSNPMQFNKFMKAIDDIVINLTLLFNTSKILFNFEQFIKHMWIYQIGIQHVFMHVLFKKKCSKNLII